MLLWCSSTLPVSRAIIIWLPKMQFSITGTAIHRFYFLSILLGSLLCLLCIDHWIANDFFFRLSWIETFNKKPNQQLNNTSYHMAEPVDQRTMDVGYLDKKHTLGLSGRWIDSILGRGFGLTIATECKRSTNYAFIEKKLQATTWKGSNLVWYHLPHPVGNASLRLNYFYVWVNRKRCRYVVSL